ncbi:hypothetical protein ROS217_14676 [Roseovarius sp. 217]|nr:hypothetical protein ROS217_14676 [Roseovarius sp. 217]
MPEPHSAIIIGSTRASRFADKCDEGRAGAILSRFIQK